jgi:hypothetical protein
MPSEDLGHWDSALYIPTPLISQPRSKFKLLVYRTLFGPLTVTGNQALFLISASLKLVSLCNFSITGSSFTGTKAALTYSEKANSQKFPNRHRPAY